MITKKECLAVLECLADEMQYWDWDEDYMQHVKHNPDNNKSDCVDWMQDRINMIISIVNTSELE